mgnify:CR=1 FL=1
MDAIVSLSPKFEKLRNPLLRRVMAPRTSIAAASKIGGCQVNDFFEKLAPLGFEIDRSMVTEEKKPAPAFMHQLKKEQIVELDVRPVLSSGKDPLGMIVQHVRGLQQNQVLKIINSFYPEPLVQLLEKQGFEAHADIITDDLVETYFHRKEMVKLPVAAPVVNNQEGWDEVLEHYKDKLQTIDVRQLEMPLPMLTILEALEQLPAGQALFVYHKRVPVYLLPELADRKFQYRIREIDEGNVHLVIFKDGYEHEAHNS